MKKSRRHITSLLLTIIYLIIVLSSLAPLAMQSKLAAHTLTGECSGDCKIDGCSLERSAAQTCCCAQKKPNTRKASYADFTNTLPAVPSKKVASCCAIKSTDIYDDAAVSAAVTESSPQEKKSASISSKPCGSGKLLTLIDGSSTQHLPYSFNGETPFPAQDVVAFIPPERLMSRYGDPPDPPPIIS